MKKTIYIFLGLILGLGTTVSAATLTYPYQGGTGIGTATAGDTGKCLKVLDDSPFTYELGACGSGSGGSGNVATSTSETSGYFPTWSSTGLTPATLAGTSQLFQLSGKIGVGSTTPWGMFSIHHPSDGAVIPHFVVASSTASATTTEFIVANNGNVGIGATSPSAKFHVSADGNSVNSALISSGNDQIILSQQDAAPGFSLIASSDDLAAHRGVFKAVRSRGTLASPTIVQSGDNVFSLLGEAYDGSARRGMAEILFSVDGTPGSSDMPGRISFLTTPDGSATRAEVLTIKNSGNVGIGTTSPWAQLSVGMSSTTPAFVAGVAGSSTPALYVDSANNMGRVGIGASSPTNLLTIGTRTANYNANPTLLNVTGNETSGTGLGMQVFNHNTTDATSYAFYSMYAGDTSHGGMFFGSRQANPLFGIANGITFRAAAGQDVGFTAAPSFGSLTGPSVIIKSGGNVGIGTTTPPSLLTIGPTSAQLVSSNPLFLLGTSTLASASANGTYIGVNAPTGFSGNFIDIQNAGTSRFKVDSVGAITSGTLSVSGSTWNGSILQSINNFGLVLQGRQNSAAGTAEVSVGTNGGNSRTPTSGNNQNLLVSETFNPTSGTAVFNQLESAGTINQTGNSSGVTRGIYVNPTLTLARDYRALEIAPYTFNMNLSTTTLVSTLFNAPTFASTSAATLTNGYTKQITGAPIASTNVTISTSTALKIDGGAVNGGGTVTNAYGLQVYAPTGATNNYAAQFVNGPVKVTEADVYIASSTRGMVLTSPDGTCYRFTVANGGALSAGAAITCP